INLDLVNGNGETINLIFGVGHRATHGVDPLYGEFAYQYPLSTNDFDARWYPKDDDGTNIVPFGLGDMAPNALNPRSNSRDIRNYYATSHSLAYYCEFNAVQYPLTIEWDINDFTILLPDGTQEEPTLYIRDIVNGVPQQGTNMRNATRTGATTFAYTISDPRVTSFLIEYTLPQVVEYLDELGNPIIKDGWNLLSMPVLPVNTEWDQVFPLATNKPWRFYNNNYQQEEVLKPGQGYFVKYEDVVDTRFKGATLVNISPDMGYNIRLTGGWNTIGALSIPMSINDIDFEPFQPGIVPDIDEALAKGVYEYRTDQGYFEVSQLVPGLGYWLYANQQGYLALRAQKFNAAQDQSNIRKETVLAQSVKIDLNDNAQHSKSLYLTENNRVDLGNFEYPPVPPMELFDVRFSNNGYLEMAGEATMMLQGVEYPISIAMQNPDAVYTLTDAVTGEVFGQITEDNNVIEIEKVKSDRIKIEKADAEGFEFKAYPNPASSFANVMFSVPESGNVNIALYDAIGNKVMTIADAQFDAGSHSASINAADLSAGNYILRITAGNNTAVTKITIIK
ncbi:MAG: T9SS type A sorting domain-containing protein, partial [Candidatus Kapaibacterium sp.]